MSHFNRFNGKVAFITRVGSGIGRATAVAFAAEGACVAILDRTEDALRDTADAIRSADGHVLPIACDVSKPEQVEMAVARTVETFGHLDLPSTTLASRTSRLRSPRSNWTNGIAFSISTCAAPSYA